jgi:hypothetical protein
MVTNITFKKKKILKQENLKNKIKLLCHSIPAPKAEITKGKEELSIL